MFLTHKTSCSTNYKSQVSSSSSPQKQRTFTDKQTNTHEIPHQASRLVTCIQCRLTVDTAEDLVMHIKSYHGVCLASSPSPTSSQCSPSPTSSCFSSPTSPSSPSYLPVPGLLYSHPPGYP